MVVLFRAKIRTHCSHSSGHPEMQPEPILVRKSKEHPFAARFGTQQMRSGQLVAQSARVGSAKDAVPRVQGDDSNPIPDADIPTSPKIFHLRQLRHGAEHRHSFLCANQASPACFSGQEARPETATNTRWASTLPRV